MAGVCTMADNFDNSENDYEYEERTLGRDSILQVNDVEVEKVPVPEWGGTVFVKTILAGEWDDFEDSMVSIENGVAKKANLKDYRARFAAMVLCDAKGEALFTAKDIPALSKKSRSALDRVLEAGKRINRVSESDEEAIVENLKQTPDGNL